MWQDIVTSLLTSGFITGIFVFILNKAIESKFDMKLESYKDKLKFESDKEMLQLTKDLELKASERNIKLTGSFEAQAKVVATIYQKLVCLHDIIRTSVIHTGSNPQISPENLREIWAERAKFYNYFSINRIYLPNITETRIEEFEQTIFIEMMNFFSGAKGAQAGGYDKFINETPKLLQQLKDDFHSILGLSPAA
jgi:hypothetical protein